ncbi:MAG: hypothetical protein R3353_00075 [Salegentibacter mishustinae]|nr:hypothetical protein [Salegentibacter mishustinae]
MWVGALGTKTGKTNKDLEGNFTVSFSIFYIGTRSQIEITFKEAKKLDIGKIADLTNKNRHHGRFFIYRVASLNKKLCLARPALGDRRVLYFLRKTQKVYLED